MPKHRKCKKWCGTRKRTKKLYPDDPHMWVITFCTRKCRDRACK